MPSGSSLAVRDQAGVLQSRNEYDAFGQETVVQAGTKSDYRFSAKSGYVTDDETGFQLLGSRYYIPRLGRFITQDPIGLQGGLNLYIYCGDSPLLRSDPNGLDWLDNAANFFGGWGDSLTGGVTGALAKAINRSLGYGEFQYVGGWFTAGQVAGFVNGSLISAAGGIRAVRIVQAIRESNAGKMAFLFGKASAALEDASKADAIAANVRRSLSMYEKLKRIGQYDTPEIRSYVLKQLYKSFLDPRSIVSKEGANVWRETLVYGPRGAVKVKSLRKGSKLITARVLTGSAWSIRK